MAAPPITRVVLYKHGVGYFEREGPVEGDAALALTFNKEAEKYGKRYTEADVKAWREEQPGERRPRQVAAAAAPVNGSEEGSATVVLWQLVALLKVPSSA